MALKSPVWQVTIHYTDGTDHVEDDVRNFRQKAAENQVEAHCADKTKVIGYITSVQTGAKFSGEI
jgi:hypothetical protein